MSDEHEQGAYLVYNNPKAPHLDPSVMTIAPYKRGFVDDIKRIPSRYREYVPELKTWIVFPPYIDTLKDLIYSYYTPVVILYDAPQSQQTQQHAHEQPPNPDKDHRMLGLLPGASERLIRAAYRVRAQEVHPDTAQNPQYKDGKLFVEVRTAYERLLAKYGAKP